MSRRGMTGASLLVIATLVHGAARGADTVRESCLACLKPLQEHVQALLRKYPEELGHLGAGAIDEETLSLHFPVTDPRRRFRTTLRGRGFTKQEQGLFFQFSHPIPRGPEPLGGQIQWLCIDAEFAWSWGWANKPLEGVPRGDLLRATRRALRPLDDAETAALAADLARRDGAPYVLRGSPKVELKARVAKEQGPRGTQTIELYEANGTGKLIALCPLHWQHTEVVQDGRLLPHGKLDARFARISGREDPFHYYAPDERKRMLVWSRRELSPGRYRFRFVIGHVRDGWTDVTPTYADAAPIYRRVENAWLGVLVSNEMEFTVEEPPAGGDPGNGPADTRRP